MPSKVLSVADARKFRDRLHAGGRKLVFSNGCFDILHRGHVQYLEFARAQGDALIVGLNSDSSVSRNKGPGRPINSEEDRAIVLAALRAVDGVVIFDEDEPRTLIEAILPHVLVKGRDWAHYVSGREIVEAHGGRVVLAELSEGHSTTNTIERILRAEAV
ncbi:MAG TPA: D-glycero-beta-D-manno-heptose 1-phosphate adenylyltransferase [Terrimicrobiaceae bacterium]|nr:D-glycero-beta-D-manno-heptose 1-phosphate adenylyltransferase [Terrimicrobiaceae bacterium]